MEQKILSLLLAMVMIVSVGFQVHADEIEIPKADDSIQEIDGNRENGLYLASEQISDDVIKYAESQKPIVFNSLKDILSSETGEISVAYGSPFKLNTVDYIPIIADNKVISLLAIIKMNGEYGWSLSKDFSQGLNKISNITSIENPANLYTDRGNVYAVIAGDTHQLTFNPEIPTVELGSTRISTNAEIVNLLNFESETQHINIVNLDSTLKDKSILNKQLIKYAKKKNSNPTKKSSAISFSSVKKQIDAGKPIYLGCEGKDTYKKARHALVLRGYDSDTYSVWNPWDAEYVSMSQSTKSIAVSGDSFVWDSTIYGW